MEELEWPFTLEELHNEAELVECWATLAIGLLKRLQEDTRTFRVHHILHMNEAEILRCWATLANQLIHRWPEYARRFLVDHFKLLRCWATLANQLINRWQEYTRTFLVHHFKLSHSPPSWRPILQKLSRTYLC